MRNLTGLLVLWTYLAPFLLYLYLLQWPVRWGTGVGGVLALCVSAMVGIVTLLCLPFMKRTRRLTVLFYLSSALIAVFFCYRSYAICLI